MEYFINKNKEKPLPVSLALVLSIAVIAINPYGFEMLSRPLEIFSQLSTNKYTTELSNYTTHEYWQTSTYFTLCFLVITFLGMFSIAFEKSNENRLKHLVNQFGLANILLVIAFTILATVPETSSKPRVDESLGPGSKLIPMRLKSSSSFNILSP